MTVTFEELMTPVPQSEVLAASIEVAQDLELPVTSWQETSVAREMMYISAQTGANVSAALTPIARGGLLDYAEGPWLTLLAAQQFDVTRIQSTFATGNIRLSNSTATPHTFAAGDVRLINDQTGATYTNQTGGTLAASPGTLTLEFSADEPGSASDFTSGQTLTLVVSIPGVTASWVADLLGTDEELDPALRQRCRDSLGRASPNGPAAAYDYFAKSTLRPDGTNVGVTRTRRIEANATVYVYVADPDGVVTSEDVELIQENIDANCVPTGFTAVVASASTLAIAISMTLTPSPTSTEDQATTQTRITAAIADYFSTIGVGGDDAASFRGVYLSTLITIIRVAAGSAVVDVTLSLPAADVALAVNQVPVISGTPTYVWAA